MAWRGEGSEDIYLIGRLKHSFIYVKPNLNAKFFKENLCLKSRALVGPRLTPALCRGTQAAPCRGLPFQSSFFCGWVPDTAGVFLIIVGLVPMAR